MDDAVYKALRRHLDCLPVGFPATRSGVELRILKSLFTPGEARLATALTHRFETVNAICSRMAPGLEEDPEVLQVGACRRMLEKMAEKGSIFRKASPDGFLYALAPLVIGMFEFQVARLTRDLYEDVARYFREAFGLSYLSTALPQMRVVPVSESVSSLHHIATYDEIRQIIAQAKGRIGVAECICRKGRDITGEPCGKTGRRELCLVFRDYFDAFSGQGWLRPVNSQEALAILSRSEEEGLVLQATNEQYPQAVCSCCGCCCGILQTLKAIPNPSDFVAANFRARVDAAKCKACGVCAERCHMGAISREDRDQEGGKERAVRLDPKRCIGCGVCIPACPAHALELVVKQRCHIPPETTEKLYERLMEDKERWAKARTAFKILRNSRWRDISNLLRPSG